MAPSGKKSLKDLAGENPSQIGDPVSLKAETADSHPTEQDTAAKKTGSRDTSIKHPTEQDLGSDGEGLKAKKSLKETAESKLKEGNASQLGDPVSLKAETADSEPTADDRGALGTSKNSGKPKI